MVIVCHAMRKYVAPRYLIFVCQMRYKQADIYTLITLAAVDSNLCITAHNKLRALHQNTGGLVWSQDLANKAQRWAEENLRNNRMKHEQIEGQGENIYYGNNLLEADCTDAALAW